MDLDIEWEEEVVKQTSPFTVIPMDIDIEAVTNKVLSAKDKWINRSKDYPFYTLGSRPIVTGKQ